MKHYVLGFLFNKDTSKVLLALKKSPEWQAGKWNGLGGKVEDDDSSPTNTIYIVKVEKRLVLMSVNGSTK